jgi:F-type H+-transporting ATPase subunit a
MVSETMGDRCISYTPFVMAILILVGLSNLLGLLGMYPPTADVSIPLGWSISVFLIITREKLRGGIGGYLKGFLEPIFVFAPLNVVSEVALPVSMAFRLFGNILSGVVISELLLWALGNFSILVFSWLTDAIASFPIFQVGVPAIFSLYFDVFSGCLQAYVFSMLAMINISMAGSDE